MKKFIYTTSIFVTIAIALTGCMSSSVSSVNGSDDTNVTTTTVQTTKATTVATTNKKVTVAYDSIVVNDNNSIDKDFIDDFDNAMSTIQINQVSKEYCDAWEKELKNVVSKCEKLDGYNQNEYNSLLNSASTEYNKQIKAYEGGSGAAAAAYMAKAEVLKKMTYYYVEICKQNNVDYKL